MRDLLAADLVPVNYDPNRRTREDVDHGPQGIASTIAQAYKMDGQRKEQWWTVYHTSRRLRERT